MSKSRTLNKEENCRLCGTISPTFISSLVNSLERSYLKCPNCHAVFMSKQYLSDDHIEFERYKTHNNDVNDSGYRNFVSPITNEILKDFDNKAKGLDFGSEIGRAHV